MPITRAYGQASQLGNTPAASNPVLNSAFDIWQRGTSIASGAGAPYTADRWQIFRSGAASGATVSRQTTSDTTNLPFIQYSARVQRDSGNTSTAALHLTNNFETVNSIPYAGKTVTLSFYARKGANYSSASNLLNANIRTGTGTDQTWVGGYTGLATPLSADVTLTDTWQRFSASATLSASLTELAVQFAYNPVGTAGANDWFEVTGVQIDIGSVALPYRRNSATLAGELAAASRYYQRFTASANYSPIFPSGYVDTSTSAVNQAFFPVRMRTKPSSVEYANARIVDAAGSTYNISAIALTANVTEHIAEIQSTITGGTGGRYCYIQANNNAGAYVGFSAEL
jgi:hypothetical protein